jgi:putative transposase
MTRPLQERRSLVEMDVKLSIEKQCELMSIHKSGVYYKPRSENEENLLIMRFLDEQYFKTPFYGIRRLTVLLESKGYCINRKRVKRLMKLINWQTIYRKPRTTISDKASYKYPYLLRDLVVERTNQVWATDITYIPMKEGFMYLTAIIDLKSRFILNWSVSNTMSAEWCAEMLKQAIHEHGKPEIVNTDQGTQYTSEVFINVLKSNQIQISMDGKGRAIDNIFIERFWKTIKYEDVYLKTYKDGLDLHQGIKAFINFYNYERLHQSLDYKTPKSVYLMAAA